MESAKNGTRNDAPVHLYGTGIRSVVRKRKVRAVVVVVIGISLQHAPQMRSVRDDHVVETFLPFGSLSKMVWFIQ